MHVLVAVPGKAHLDALSPLLSALGERVVPVANDVSSAGQMSRMAVISAFQGVMNGTSDATVFPTTFSPAWAIFDALLAEVTNRRALIFYEPASIGIARKLERGMSAAEATALWSADARNLLEFVRTNSRNVMIVAIDDALSAPRTLLEACADRYLFDLVDYTAKPAQSSLPSIPFRVVAESIVHHTPALSALDDRLASQSLGMEAGAAADLGSLDRFISDYRRLVDSQRHHARVLAEVESLRKANQLAENSAQALRVELADSEARLKHGLSRAPLAGVQNGNRHEAIAALEVENANLRTVLEDVQSLAETNLSEAANLRARFDDDRRHLSKLEAELRSLSSKQAAAAAESEASAKINTAMSKTASPKSAPARAPKRAFQFRPRRWLRTRRDAALVSRSGLFDASWYLERNEDIQALGTDPVKHFVRYGGQEGRAPGPAFSSRLYLDDNPDVAKAGLNPLLHYLRLGKAEGRKIRRSE